MEEFAKYILENKNYVFRLTKMVDCTRDQYQFRLSIGATVVGHPSLIETGRNLEYTNLSVGGWDGITTSPILTVDLEYENTYKVRTLNSIYILTKIKL